VVSGPSARARPPSSACAATRTCAAITVTPQPRARTSGRRDYRFVEEF
jgi:hypothetical protein